MEFIGQEPYAVYLVLYSSNISNFIMMYFRHGNFHFSKCCGCANVEGGIYNHTSSVSSDYHIFAVEWSPSNITWYTSCLILFPYSLLPFSYTHYRFFEDKPFLVIPQTAGISDITPHYFILNLAVGGKFSGYPDASTPFPSVYCIFCKEISNHFLNIYHDKGKM